MLTHLEPDILECEVKWVLGSITTNKASRGDEIPVKLFQILKDDAVKVLPSICPEIWKTHQRPQDWKRSVFIPIPKKGNAKECSNYCTIAIWKTQQWPKDWKRSEFIPIPKKGNARECLNYCTIALILHARNAQYSYSQASTVQEP